MVETSTSRRRKVSRYFLGVLAVSTVVFITLSLNLVYYVRKELYQPNKRVDVNPQSINIFYEEVDFKTEDGQNISGWFIPAPAAKAVVLFCPGKSGNLGDQLAKIKFFHDAGVHLLMFDYRGYGRSTGRPSEKGFYMDVRAAYDFLISRNDIDPDKIVAVGESLGGASAADLCLHRKVRALVLESSIVSVPIKAKHLYPFLPVSFLLPEKFDTLSKVKTIRIPKLFLHGLDDENIDFADALQLYYASPPPKRFLPFRGTHDDDIFRISEVYKDELTKFLRENNLM